MSVIKQTNRDMLLDLYDDVSAIKYTLQEMRHDLSQLRTIATQTNDIKRDLAYIKSLLKPTAPNGDKAHAVAQSNVGSWTLW
jgi:hypothetical protein|tara:strand:+ start:224 stop:469 length:246 start_codon:yes stop_codon:yes gene_type:complete